MKLKHAFDTLKEVAAIYVLLIILSAGFFSVFEGRSVAESMYWAVTTATSTGYGDISPATMPGRVVAMVLMHLAIFFVIPLIVVHLITQVIENKNEFTHEEQEQVKADNKQLLADVAAIKAHLGINEDD